MADEFKALDLTKVYDDTITTRPFDLTDTSDYQTPEYITGADLSNLARIDSSWKDPQFQIPSALDANNIRGADLTKPEEAVATYVRAVVNKVENLPDKWNILTTQVLLQQRGIDQKSAIKAPESMKESLLKSLAYDPDIIEQLDGREYPDIKWAQDTIANATKAVQDRELATALNKLQRGIDSKAWSNKFAEILGDMTPILAVGYATGGIASALGASAETAGALATGAAKVATFADMSGQYAYDTAREYLERTGDSDFRNFTAKDAKGLSALGYGAIGTMIEFGFGGVEPLVSQAFTKAGIEQGVMKAVGKVAIGEAWEEFLQEWEEFLFRKVDGTGNRTYAQALKDSIQAALWGGLTGGALGGVVYRTNRRNIANILTQTGLDYKDALKVADTALSDLQNNIQENAEAVLSIKNKTGKPYNDLRLAVDDAIKVVESQGRRVVRPEEREEFIDGIVDNWGIFAINQADLLNMTISDFLSDIQPRYENGEIRMYEAGYMSPQYTYERLGEIEKRIADIESGIASQAEQEKYNQYKNLAGQLKKINAVRIAQEKAKARKAQQQAVKTIENTPKTITAEVDVAETPVAPQGEETQVVEYSDQDVLGRFGKALADKEIVLSNWENVRWSSLLGEGVKKTKTGMRYEPATEKQKANFARKMLDKYKAGWNQPQAQQKQPTQPSKDAKKIEKGAYDINKFYNSLSDTEKAKYQMGETVDPALQERFDNALLSWIINDPQLYNQLVVGGDPRGERIINALRPVAQQFVEFNLTAPTEYRIDDFFRVALGNYITFYGTPNIAEFYRSNDMFGVGGFDSNTILYAMRETNTPSGLSDFLQAYIDGVVRNQQSTEFGEQARSEILAEIIDKSFQSKKGTDQYNSLFTQFQQGATYPPAPLEEVSPLAVLGYRWSGVRLTKDGETGHYAFRNEKAARDFVEEAKKHGYKDEDIEVVGFDEIPTEQFDLADENARLDDIYPAYDGETIEVDGKERTVYNSDGNRIAKSAEALRNFWRWFGDSKVVDEQGRPLVVYHGTNAKFDAFSRGYHGGTWGTGIYFGKEDTAKYYGQQVLGVYLKMQNPFFVENQDTYRKIAPEANAVYEKYRETLSEEETELIYDDDIITWYLQEQGFDGVIDAIKIENANEFVVFEPTQIKSVDNRGTYSEDTGNILYDEIETKKVSEDRTNANKWLKEQDGVVKEAVEYFGLTDDLNEAGYILPDGSLLDFSGKNMGGTAGVRSLDHREIAQAYDPEMTGHETNYPDLVVMEDFINAGSIRFISTSGTLLMAHKPTFDQYQTIKRILDKFNGEIQIEFVSDAENWGSYREGNFYYEMPEMSGIEDVKRLANAFYSGEGITPAMLALSGADTYYQGSPSQWRGMFNMIRGAVAISGSVKASTIQHELAHFWLDNMWNRYKSGKYTEDWFNNFSAIAKWLGLNLDAEYISTPAHEQFARGYEAFISGRTIADVAGLKPAFDRYDRFVRRVYKTARDIRYRDATGHPTNPVFTKEAFDAFDRLLQVPDGVEVATNAELIPQTKEEKDENAKIIKKSIQETRTKITEAQDQRAKENPVDVPILRTTGYAKDTDGKVKKSKNGYYIVSTQEGQEKKALDLIKSNPQLAESIIWGGANQTDIDRGVLARAYANFIKDTDPAKAELIREYEITTISRSAAKTLSHIPRNDLYRSAARQILAQKTRNLAQANYGLSAGMVEEFEKDLENRVALAWEAVKNAPLEQRQAIAQQQIREIVADFSTVDEVPEVMADTDFTQVNERTFTEMATAQIRRMLGLTLTQDESEKLELLVEKIEDAMQGDSWERQHYLTVETAQLLRQYSEFIAGYTPKSVYDKTTKLYYPAAMLFNIPTHAKNMITNTFQQVASVLSVARSVTQIEIPMEQLKKDAEYDIKLYVKTGFMPSIMTDITSPQQVLGEKRMILENPNWFDIVAEKSLNWLSIEDSVFKSLSFYRELAIMASQQARKEGLTGKALKARALELYREGRALRGQTEWGIETRAMATEIAKVDTFIGSNNWTRFMKSARNTINLIQLRGRSLNLGNILSPFIVVGTNVVRGGFNLTGLPIASGIAIDLFHPQTRINDTKVSELIDLDILSEKQARALFKGGKINQRVAKTLIAEGQITEEELKGLTYTERFGTATTRGLAETGVAWLAIIGMLAALGDDDWMPEYDDATSAEKARAKAEGIQFGSIRIGGVWVSTDLFGYLKYPITWAMNTRRFGAKAIPEGMVSALADLPVVSDAVDLWRKNKYNRTTQDYLLTLGDTIIDKFNGMIPGVINNAKRIGQKSGVIPTIKLKGKGDTIKFEKTRDFDLTDIVLYSLFGQAISKE